MKLFIFIAPFLVVIIAGFASLAVSPQKQGGLAASVKRGSTVYEQFCLPCHQANGAGVQNLNPPLIKTKWVLGDKKTLVTVVLKGLSGEIKIGEDIYQNEMPPHNYLTDAQVADVLTYVRNSFGNKATAVTPIDVKGVRSKLKL